VVRYTFTVTDFHRLPIAGLPAHPSTASKADLAHTTIGDKTAVADHVRLLGHRVSRSDVDLLGNLDGVVDLDAEVANGAFDFRMAE